MRMSLSFSLRKELQTMKSDMKKLVDHERRLLEQNQIIAEQTRKIAEQDKLIAQMNRRMIDSEKRMRSFRRTCLKKMVRTPPVDVASTSDTVGCSDDVKDSTLTTEQCIELVRTNEANKRACSRDEEREPTEKRIKIECS